MTFPVEEETPDLAEALRVAVRHDAAAGGQGAIAGTLARRHPADVASAMRELPFPEALAVFLSLDSARAAEVLDEVDPEVARYLIANAPPLRISALLGRLPPDDAAEVFEHADHDDVERLMRDFAAHAPTQAAVVADLLLYPDGSTGRLMTTRFLALPGTATARTTLAALRIRGASLDVFSDVYVLTPSETLAGVAPLRSIITADPDARLASFMASNVASARPETPAHEVARNIAHYDLASMPVVDDDAHLIGVVTVDDAIDVLIDELNEDYFRIVGSDADEMDRRNPAQVAKLRLPWLLGTMAIELLAGAVIAGFDDVLKRVILLASFMPVISAISGNVGLQSAAIVVRGLDTGHVTTRNWGRHVARELMSALLLALACGVVLGVIGAIWSQHLGFGLIIGGALICSMLTAGLMGSVIPVVSKRLGFDPAATAGPFETAFQDVIGFAVFLWLASLLEPWLH
jgi:magnesium transporter